MAAQRTRTSKKPAKSNGMQPGARVSCRALIALDTSRLRKADLKKLDRAKKTYSNLESQWNQFEHVEKPAYIRWVRTHCGTKIEDIRQIQEKIDLLSRTLNLAEALRAHYPRRSMYACAEAAVYYYANAGKSPEGFEDFFVVETPDDQEDRSAGHGSAFDADDDADGNNPFDADGFSFFDDLIDEMLGEDQDDVGDMFGDVFGAPRTASVRDDNFMGRIKAVYRQIARRLHPDQGGTGEASQLELWYEAQQAYANHDIETLDRIHAHCDLLDEGNAMKAPVSSIRNGIAHFKKACSSLNRRIRAARSELEWGFLTWNEQKRKRHLNRVLAELRDDFSIMTYQHDHLQRELDRFLRRSRSHKSSTRKKAASSSRRVPDPFADSDQALFDFF